MTRIVLDTNVFISGIFWSDPPSRVLDAWYEKKVKLVISPEILDEYIRACRHLPSRSGNLSKSAQFAAENGNCRQALE